VTISTTRATGRRLAPLALVFLTVGLSTAMAAPFLVLFLNDAVHAGATQVAVFLAVAPASAVLASTLIGKLSDRLPHRRVVLAASAFAGSAATALTAVVRDYHALLLVTVTLTACTAAMMPQAFAYAREALHDSDRVAMAMSSLRTLFSVAWVAGPPIAAVLLETGGFRLLYGVSSIMYAAAGLTVLTALRNTRPVETAADTAPRPGQAGADAPRRVIWVTVVIFVIGRAAGNLAVQALPLFTIRELGGGVRDAGLLLGLCAGLEIPLMLGFGYLSTRMPVHRLLIAGTGCALAYALLVLVATSEWELVAGQLLNAASIAALTGLGITYVQDMLPRRRGRASTLYSNTFPIGAVIAGPILGAAQHAGFRMPYAASAALSAIALGLLVLSGRHTEKSPAAAMSPADPPGQYGHQQNESVEEHTP
jgi:SET family sugar efflux transporter-like MFS transporter